MLNKIFSIFGGIKRLLRSGDHMVLITKLCIIATGVVIAFFIVCLFNRAYAGTSPSQSAVSGSQSAAGASINYDDHSKNSVIDRQFAPSSGNVTAHTQGRYTEIKGADVSYRPAHEFLMFGGVWSEGSLKAMAAGGDVKYSFPIVNDYEKPSNMSPDGNRYILILTGQRIPQSFKASVPYDAEADDTNTNSFQIIALMALKALQNGDNVLLITHEGFNDKIYASGWGIGTHAVGAVVNESGKVSGTGGGGFGVSKNNSGEERMPWIRGYSGCVPIEIHGHKVGMKTKSNSHGNRSNDIVQNSVGR